MRQSLRYQSKLLYGVLFSLLLCCGTATLVTFWVIERKIYDVAHREMEFSAFGMHAMLQNMISVSARAHLQGLAQGGHDLAPNTLRKYSIVLSRQQKQARAPIPCRDAILTQGYDYFRQQADPYREIRASSDSLCMTWTEVVGHERIRIYYLDSKQLNHLLDIEQLDLALPPISGSEDFFVIDRKSNGHVFSSNRQGKDYSPVDLRTGKSLTQLVLEHFSPQREKTQGSACCGNIEFIDSEQGHHRDAIYRHIPDFDWVLVVLTDLEHVQGLLKQLRWLMGAAIVLELGLTALLLRQVLRSMTEELGTLVNYVALIDGRTSHTPRLIPGDDEIGRLGTAFLDMEQRLIQYTGTLEERVAERTRALEEANRSLAEQALHDPLTGLANRRFFDQRMAEEISRAKRSQTPFSLLLLDVDHFKKYNDHYGHPAGDLCLHNIAQALRAHFQRSTDFCARIGGEEFAVILPGLAPTQAQELGRTLCRRIAEEHWPHAQSPNTYVTVSAGIASWQAGNSAEDIYKRSDLALYDAKSGGRNQCQADTPLPGVQSTAS